jgi:phosphoribosylformimino-5-aminoimidazole carboxamide ribotide isomerase
MLIVPAIDIIGGRVVRLARGAFDQVSVYDLTPLAFAQKWVEEGARFIHVVDLDGAKSGVPKNFDAIRDVVRRVSVKVEVGGGIRTAASVRQYRETGVERVVLSTKIIDDATFLLHRDIKDYAGRLAVSVDIKAMASDGTLTSGTGGWLESGDKPIDLDDFLKVVASAGVLYVNFSDISKDGMLSGPDKDKVRRFITYAKKVSADAFYFTYAGGIATLDDLRALKSLGADGPDAVIIGRALYENKFTLKEAIEAVR